MKVLDAFKIVTLLAATFALMAVGFAGLELKMTFLKLQSLTDQSQLMVQDARTSVRNTSQMINANLIHMDLILGRAEVLSRSQEDYWKMVSKKTELTLDNANTVLANLATTTRDLDSNLKEVTQTTNETLKQVQPVLQETTKAIQSTNLLISDPAVKETLKNVDQGTAQIAATATNVNKTTQDIQEKVHKILHPSWASRISSWVTSAAKTAILFFK